MKTRDRILETALQLFNEQGEPNVSTLEIATEMGISPGNLYYHFHGKEPLVMELFERFQAELAPLLDPPHGAELSAEDYWLFLHLIVERLASYRFLFQDLSNLSGRLPKLARGIRQWLNQLKRTLASLLARLKALGQLRSDTPRPGPAGRADHPDPAVLPRLSAHTRRPGRSPSGGVPGNDAGRPAPHR